MGRRADKHEPPPGPPAEGTRWIFANPQDHSFGDGQRIVELLLAGRGPEQLSTEELDLLVRGYNWWGKHDEAFAAARLNLARAPDCEERWRTACVYAFIAYTHDLSGFVAACDGCIAEGLGPAAFWHLAKADQYIAFGTGERSRPDGAPEWVPGDPVPQPELLGPAAAALGAALVSHPRLREDESAHGWVGDWNLRFAAILQQPEFRHLAA